MYNFTISSLFMIYGGITPFPRIIYCKSKRSNHFVRSAGVRADMTVLSEKNYWLKLLSQLVG